MTITIPDDVAAALLAALQGPAPAAQSFGPALVSGKSNNPMGGPPFAVELIATDGSGTKKLTVGLVPSPLDFSTPSFKGPYIVSFNAGTAEDYDVIVGVKPA